jgi:hypothetical protein
MAGHMHFSQRLDRFVEPFRRAGAVAGITVALALLIASVMVVERREFWCYPSSSVAGSGSA